MAVNEWWRYLAPRPPHPITATVIAAIVVAGCAYWLVAIRKRLIRLRQGLDGEKAVGQYLEKHREPDWRVFHDIPCNGFNIDHLLVAPQGIFVIETKTYSKRCSGQRPIKYDGDALYVNGGPPNRRPIRQAQNARDWLQDQLQRDTERTYPLRGVVIFPDWYIEGPGDYGRVEIWVLNQQALPEFMKHEPTRMSEEDMDRVCDRIRDLVDRLSQAATESL